MKEEDRELFDLGEKPTVRDATLWEKYSENWRSFSPLVPVDLMDKDGFDKALLELRAELDEVKQRKDELATEVEESGVEFMQVLNELEAVRKERDQLKEKIEGCPLH